MRSLVIDDQITARTLLRCILESYGDVAEAEAGQEGLTHFEQALADDEPYDLICIDQGLPDIEGNDVLARIREHEATLGRTTGNGAATVFIITASDDPVVAEVAQENRVDAYLNKPVSYAGLIDAFGQVGLQV